MSIDGATARPVRSWLGRAIIAVTVAVALCLGGAIALATPFQDGATRLFGKVVDGVKDHPQATAILCLAGVGALWLTIGLAAAGQEWRNRGAGH